MKRQVVGLVTVAMLALAACSRDGGKPASSTEPAARPAAAATTSTASNDSATVNYHPVIVPADFSTGSPTRTSRSSPAPPIGSTGCATAPHSTPR